MVEQGIPVAQVESVVSAPSNVDTNSPKYEVGVGDTLTMDAIADISEATQKAKAAKQRAANGKFKAAESAESEPGESEVEEPASKAAPQKEKQTQESKVKAFKAKLGDQELELTGNTAIEIPIDGKQAPVPLQELINNYNGKTVWDKKLNEVANTRKQIEAEKAQFSEEKSSFDGFAKQLVNAVKNQDLDGLLRTVAQYANLENPDAAIQNYYAKAIESLREFETLTPEQRRIKQLERESSGVKAKLQEREMAEKEKAFQADITQRIEKVLSSENMAPELFAQRFKELNSIYQSEWKNEAERPEITPERVQDFHKACVRFDMVHNILETTNSSLLQNRQLIDQLTGILKDNPDFDESDLKEIVVSTFGKGKPSKGTSNKGDDSKLQASAKVLKNQPEIVQNKNVRAASGPRKHLTFDDLDVF
jgi:hypothetical protein